MQDQKDKFRLLRELMVTEQIADRGIKNPSVLNIMKKIPRHLFVPESIQNDAYNDYPLSIGNGQTISQPYIVALMTELLEPGKEKRILEIGTGSGYQTAILSSLVKEVYTIERIKELYEKSKSLLNELGYSNIHYRLGDGYEGWPESAPYDGIIVTAAPENTPAEYLKQLKEGGRLVIPVGGFLEQYLKLIIKEKNGRLKEQIVCGVRFVELVKE